MDSLEEIIGYEQFDNLEFITSQIVAGFITGLHRSPNPSVTQTKEGFRKVLLPYLIKRSKLY